MAPIWKSEHWPKFGYDPKAVESGLLAYSERLGQVRGLHEAMSSEERAAVILNEITREAIHSFGIEGVTLDPDEVEASVVASLAHRNLHGASRRSDAVAALMLDARDATGPLDEVRLHQWHRLLFSGVEVEEPGQWRSFDMVIVKSARAGREDVLYKAVPPARLPVEMKKFFDWVAAPSNMPLAIRAAIAHLWFESIHPYSDGNGRIGRAIVEHIFARSEALPFSLSRQIEADKKAYYLALQAGRKPGAGIIDATDFVVWFLGALNRAVERSVDEARFLVRRNQFFQTHRLSDRQEVVLRRLFREGRERVELGIGAKAYARIGKVSSATATRDLRDLLARGILDKGEEGGRSTRYFLNLFQ